MRAPFAHSHETRSGHGRADRPRDLLDPGAGLGERVLRHDRDPDLDAALAGRLGIAADAEVPERGPVQPGQDERLLPGRLRRPGRCRCSAKVGCHGLGQSPGPGVDLEAGLVAEPAQGRRAVGDEVVVRVAVLAAVDARLVPAGQPGRRGRRDVLLPEAGRAGAVRETLEVERPIREVRQHRRRDPGEVADELALRDRRVRPRTAPCRGWSASARGRRPSRRPPCRARRARRARRRVTCHGTRGSSWSGVSSMPSASGSSLDRWPVRCRGP